MRLPIRMKLFALVVALAYKNRATVSKFQNIAMLYILVCCFGAVHRLCTFCITLKMTIVDCAFTIVDML